MLYLYGACGPYFFPLMIMNLLILFFVIRKIIDVTGNRKKTASELEYGLNSILFWGFMSALLGTLGQLSGIYNALNIIIKAAEINPRIIAEGFTISFVSTLWGMLTFFVAALIWYLLKCRIKSKTVL
ncbi:MAG: MotA/TolQ/ExbB proton channel family protein [Candidatus Cloacimonetes bacterium]|nr:MotA/TolQ/ExbB proton channel family protein [Candidatus Cloacimonadota bacterium]